MNQATAFPQPGESRGLEHPGVIDLMTHDPLTERVELVMFEARSWDGGEEQLFQLQEKLNAYASFILDGEMAEAAPELLNKPTAIVLRCAESPSPDAVEFLAAVREQMGFQGLELEVRYQRPAADDGSCGSGCGCGAG
ncbi:MAG: DUF6572 domain-containing protein [Chthoniobacteraceae bacterium]